MTAFSDFQEVGFPIISLFCFIVIGAAAYLKCRASGIQNTVMFGLSAFLLFSAIFLVWGPDKTGATGMRNIGIHLFLLGVAGFVSSMTGNTMSSTFFVVFGAITFLCMIGSGGSFFGYYAIVSSVSNASCRGFFGSDVDTCGDYLMWLRVLSAFDIYVLGVALILALKNFSIKKVF